MWVRIRKRRLRDRFYFEPERRADVREIKRIMETPEFEAKMEAGRKEFLRGLLYGRGDGEEQVPLREMRTMSPSPGGWKVWERQQMEKRR